MSRLNGKEEEDNKTIRDDPIIGENVRFPEKVNALCLIDEEIH